MGSESSAFDIAALLRRTEKTRREHTRPNPLWWTSHVNHRIGALFTVVLLNTRVRPNVVTLLTLAVYIPTAIFLGTLQPPARIPQVLIVLIAWQIAFSLDCCDGQLARARHQASAYGAWLDQVVDIAGHVTVFSALTIFVVRAVHIDSVTAVCVTAYLVGATVAIQVAAALRNAIPTSSLPTSAPPEWFRLAVSGRHLTDYGAFLLAASILLLFPRLLLGFLLIQGSLAWLAVIGQIALNWRRDSQARQAADR